MKTLTKLNEWKKGYEQGFKDGRKIGKESAKEAFWTWVKERTARAETMRQEILKSFIEKVK